MIVRDLIESNVYQLREKIRTCPEMDLIEEYIQESVDLEKLLIKINNSIG